MNRFWRDLILPIAFWVWMLITGYAVLHLVQ